MQHIQKTAKNSKQWHAGIVQVNTIQGLNADVYLFKSGLNIVLNMQKASKEAKLNWQVSIPADIFCCKD